jgi:hypothetical protein
MGSIWLGVQGPHRREEALVLLLRGGPRGGGDEPLADAQAQLFDQLRGDDGAARPDAGGEQVAGGGRGRHRVAGREVGERRVLGRFGGRGRIGPGDRQADLAIGDLQGGPDHHAAGRERRARPAQILTGGTRQRGQRLAVVDHDAPSVRGPRVAVWIGGG